METLKKQIFTFSKQHPNIEVWTNDEKIRPYARDEAFESSLLPLAVVFARSTDEVVKLLTFASKNHIPVIPRGAGSGLSGAAVPTEKSIVLSLEQMKKILSIEKTDGIAVVEPGVITGEIRDAAEEQGLFYPPIPASVDFCTIGGNIATNAGGLCAVKYGVTREYVLGLKVVLPCGDLIHTGGPFVKNTTGYNLTQLIVGSEGTLGVVTEITLKLLPLPKERVTLLVPFEQPQDITKTIVSIIAERIVPPTLELLPKGAVDCVLSRHPNLSFPFKNNAASLLIELDSRNGSSLENELKELEKLLKKSPAGEPIISTTKAQRDEIWTVRKLVRDAISKSGNYVEADSVVPRKHVTDLVFAAEDVGKKFKINVICYGHAGDGNLHTYFLQKTIPDKEWKEISEKALSEFFKRTIALKGTISGEHGIGFLKKNYMPMAFSNTEIELMRRIKTAFDPHNILNPGKVLP